MNRFAVASLLGSLVLATICFPSKAATVILNLLFGWMAYLARVLPKIEIRWDGVVFFLLGTAVFGLLFHRIASWLRQEMGGQASPWRWRSTGQAVGLVVVVFVAGISMVGVTHQAYWLASDERDTMVPAISEDYLDNQFNLKMMGNAVLNHQQPLGRLASQSEGNEDDPKHSWMARCLPFASVQTDMDFQMPWDHPVNREQASKLVPYLLNPDLYPVVLRNGEGFGVSHYAGNQNVFDEQERLIVAANSDGASKMLLLGEVNASFQPWAKPQTNRDPELGINRSPEGFGGTSSSGGAHFLMLDGSVKFFSEDTDPEVLRALGTIDEQWKEQNQDKPD